MYDAVLARPCVFQLPSSTRANPHLPSRHSHPAPRHKPFHPSPTRPPLRGASLRRSATPCDKRMLRPARGSPMPPQPSKPPSLVPLLLSVLLLGCCRGAAGDCPDALWDCLVPGSDDPRPGRHADSAAVGGASRGRPVASVAVSSSFPPVPAPSGGSVSYGTCLDWASLRCSACNSKDEQDGAWILGKCNALVRSEEVQHM
eukprot:353880-Chlamydomonas_euryale.AAC.12